MNISFFFRCFIYTLLVSIMVYGGNLRKIGIFAWRIGIVYSIFDLILVFSYQNLGETGHLHFYCYYNVF